jgi:hypothetical protein
MTLRLNGSSSGYTELDAPAAAGSNTITLPTSNGSAEQFLKNSGTAGELEFSSMVETSTGVGIGTTSPQTKLHSSGTTNGAQATFGGSDSGLKISTFQKTDNDAGVTLDAQQSSNGTLTFATRGTERARLDSSGRLLVNKTGSPSAGEGSEAPVFIQGNTTSASGPAVLGLARGQSASEMSNGASLGIITFTDNDGNDFAEIKGACDDSAGSNDHPGRLSILTTPNGSSSPTERLRISNQGRLDIFASSSTDAHFVSSAGSAGTSIDVFRGLHSATATGTGTTSFAVRTNGNVVNTNNSYGSLSDVKLKENIADASSQWDDIKGLRVRNYNFKEETGNPTHTQLGVVAQEVETVSPGLVYETPDRDNEGTDLGTVTKSVNYSVLYMKAVKALQEAQTRIETLETKVAALEAAE